MEELSDVKVVTFLVHVAVVCRVPAEFRYILSGYKQEANFFHEAALFSRRDRFIGILQKGVFFLVQKW